MTLYRLAAKWNYGIFLVSLMAACVHVGSAQSYSVPPVPHVVVEDSAFLQHFAAIRGRWINNTELPDQETVMCLYGFVRSDTAFVEFMRPTVITPIGSVMVAYQKCSIPKPEIYGQMKYLGTAHNHSPAYLPNGGCYFSQTDETSFADDEKGVIEVVMCGQGIMWKGKK